MYLEPPFPPNWGSMEGKEQLQGQDLKLIEVLTPGNLSFLSLQRCLKNQGRPTSHLGFKSSHTGPAETLSIICCTHAFALTVPVLLLSYLKTLLHFPADFNNNWITNHLSEAFNGWSGSKQDVVNTAISIPIINCWGLLLLFVPVLVTYSIRKERVYPFLFFPYVFAIQNNATDHRRQLGEHFLYSFIQSFAFCKYSCVLNLIHHHVCVQAAISSDTQSRWN